MRPVLLTSIALLIGGGALAAVKLHSCGSTEAIARTSAPDTEADAEATGGPVATAGDVGEVGSRAEGLVPVKLTYRSGELDLPAFVYKPSGAGPFPVVVWNHGSEGLSSKPAPYQKLASFYTSKGFVLFTPGRHGHGQAPGKPFKDVVAEASGRAAQNARAVALQEEETGDLIAALEALRQLPFVDKDRIVMSGCSFGGIQTILASEKGLGIRAFVPFAPAAMSWAGNTLLRERLAKALENAKAPVFLIQAENDYNTEPSHVLGPLLKEPSRSKLYAAWGTTHAQGHGGFALNGSSVWGSDVLEFIERALAK